MVPPPASLKPYEVMSSRPRSRAAGANAAGTGTAAANRRGVDDPVVPAEQLLDESLAREVLRAPMACPPAVPVDDHRVPVHHTRVGEAVEDLHLPADAVGCAHVVVAEKRHQLAAHLTEDRVERGRDAPVRFVVDHSQAGILEARE